MLGPGTGRATGRGSPGRRSLACTSNRLWFETPIGRQSLTYAAGRATADDSKHRYTRPPATCTAMRVDLTARQLPLRLLALHDPRPVFTRVKETTLTPHKHVCLQGKKGGGEGQAVPRSRRHGKHSGPAPDLSDPEEQEQEQGGEQEGEEGEQQNGQRGRWGLEHVEASWTGLLGQKGEKLIVYVPV